MSVRKVGLLIIAAMYLVAPARAQSQTPAEENQQLRKTLEKMQAQMDKMQAEIDQLKGTTAAATPGEAAAANPPAAVEAAALASEANAPKQQTVAALQSEVSAHVGQETTTRQEFSEDNLAAARFQNVPLDPKYKGYFRLPGTQMIMKLGGYFKTDFIYDTKQAGNPDAFVPSSFPIPQAPGLNNTTISIRPTRLSVDLRAPQTRIGDVRFYVEADFFGTNATTPRLRHAYTQVANLLVGQTFTNFMDPDAFPDTLDFQGPNGLVNLRNPQFRYGFALTPSMTLHFSVEKPSSDVTFSTPQFAAQPNAPAPDGTVRLRQEFESGHFQVAGLFRSIAAYLPNGQRGTVFGWGVNGTLGLKTYGKDNLIFEVAAGHGLSRYIQDTSGLGIDAEPVPTPGSTAHLEATPAIGVEASYQHYWMKRLRSNLVYSYAAVDNSSLAAPGTYNHGTYTGSNIIWNPFGSLNVGAEFLYGWTVEQNGQKANAPRIQFSVKYNFIKVDPGE
jgi:hypothetical protein